MPDIPHKQRFYGGLTSDTHPKQIAEGDYVYMLNMRNSKVEGNQFGGAVNVKGNTKVDFPIPSGENICIGSAEDKQKQRCFYWVWNSNGNHQFLVYNLTTNTISRVLQGDLLKLNRDWLITQASVVDGRFVQWGETKVQGMDIEGNPPRYVDTDRAILDGKFCEFDVIVNTDTFNSPITNYNLRLFINGQELFITIISGTVTTPAIPNDKADLYKRLAAAINNPNNIASMFLEADDCGGCKLTLKFRQTGDTWVKVESSSETFFTLPVNRYHRFADETSIRLGRLVPVCPPTVRPFQDTTYDFNYIQDRYFQFAVRYVYWDFQRSTFGSFSVIANSPVDCSGNQSTYNAIEIDFSNVLLQDEVRLADIKRVEISAREGNSGSFRRVFEIDVCDLTYPDQKVIFRNDGSYPVIPDEEAYISAQQIPLLAASHLVVDDRSFWGGTLERYDNVECVDASVQVEYGDPQEACQQEFVTIKGKIRIVNDLSQGILRTEVFKNQPIWKASGMTYFGNLNNNRISASPSEIRCVLATQSIPLGGFTVYLAGTRYYATSKQINPTNGVTADTDNVYFIRNNSEARDVQDMAVDNGIWSEFEIQNVPKGGIYILRVASHLLREDNTAGSLYNIQNGLDWQKTSTFIRSIGGQAKHEIVIDTSNSASIIDLSSTEEILINDLTELNANDKQSVLILNTVDALTNFDGDRSALRKSIAVEYADVTFTNTAFKKRVHSPLRKTDHNGFFYCACSGQGINNVPQITVQRINSGNSPNLWQSGQNAYVGTLSQLYGDDDMLQRTSVQTIQIGRSNVAVGIYVVYNRSEPASLNFRSFVNGRVVSQTGEPVPNITLALNLCNRTGVTDANGNYSITVYAVENNARIVNLYPVNIASCCPKIDTLSISRPMTPFGALPSQFNTSNPLVLPDIVAQIEDFKRGIWKRRNRIQLGIKYYDEYSRSSKVQTSDSLNTYIPFWTEDGASKGFATVSWSINHIPPAWAKKYQIVRTLNPIYSRYLQFIIAEPRYVKTFGDTITETTWSAKDATEVYIPLSSLVDYANENSASVLSWEFLPNDRLTFMKDDTGEWYNGYFDYRVENDRVATIDDVTYLIIKFDQNQPEIKAGAMIEVYSLGRESTIDTYYEISECFDILNPGTPQRLHGAGFNGQAQTATLPATGELQYGDTYYLSRTMPVKLQDDTFLRITTDFESEFMNENVAASKVQSIGRIDIEDRDYRQTLFYSRIRFTGRYLPNSAVNGLNTSAELNYVRDENGTEIDRRFGVLVSLQYAGSLILAILQFKCVPVYMNSTPVFDLQGGSVLTKSNSIAVIAQPIREDKGTQNPESVVNENGNVYAFDALKNSWWRYGFNGLFDISDYEMNSYFDKLGDRVRASGRRVFLSVFDRKKQELIVSAPSVGETIGFCETIYGDTAKNRWTSYYSFVPDMMGIIGEQLISWKNGELWTHDTNEIRTSFYGQIWGCGVDFYAVSAPDVKKIFKNMRIKSNGRFITAPKGIEVYEGEGNTVMVSELRADHITNYEGDWWADLLRDMDDREFANIPDIPTREATALLRGRVLRGDYALIKLRNNSTDIVTLWSVDIVSSVSQKTKE